jgi:hypothetical protein
LFQPSGRAVMVMSAQKQTSAHDDHTRNGRGATNRTILPNVPGPIAKCSRVDCQMFLSTSETSAIASVSLLSHFDRARMGDCACAEGVGRVVLSTACRRNFPASRIALGTRCCARNRTENRRGTGRFKLGRVEREASRNPRHRNHTSCAATAKSARGQSYWSSDPGSYARASSCARGGDRRKTHPWRGRPG